jgi:hypothetical protein
MQPAQIIAIAALVIGLLAVLWYFLTNLTPTQAMNIAPFPNSPTPGELRALGAVNESVARAMANGIHSLDAASVTNTPTPRLLIFTSANCGGCRNVGSVAASLQRSHSTSFSTTVVNVEGSDEETRLADDMGIDATPTVLLAHRGRVVRYSGPLEATRIVTWTSRQL